MNFGMNYIIPATTNDVNVVTCQLRSLYRMF